MARQATNPVNFQRTTRVDNWGIMTSGRAGKVTPVSYAPILRGDSASGTVSVDLELAEMPRPLLNGVMLNVQAWFVPKAALPKFSGYDDFMASYHGEQIKALGQPDRDPPPFFQVSTSDEARNADFYKTLGIHVPDGQGVNSDLIDSFVHIWNFRAAAHSDRIEKMKYWGEGPNLYSQQLPAAFWPSDWRSRMVPDYERALILGALDLDVSAGQLDVFGLAYDPSATASPNDWEATDDGTSLPDTGVRDVAVDADARTRKGYNDGYGSGVSAVWAEMQGESIATTLADIDKARELQSFARLRASYQGNDINAYANDDTIVAELMQGFSVPEDQYRRPWLLDSKRVPFGFAERHATDAANLDQSVSQGRVNANLSINLPRQETGGVVIVTVEVLPERVDERQSDEYMYLTDPAQLPDALRDVQRVEPVDYVLNRRIDARHSLPDGLYAYEPMNDVWNRNQLRLGGAFYQDDPQNINTEQRSALWITNIVDPVFSEDHYLAPDPFPHYVFADTTAPAFEVVARHSLSIVGLTQFGDVLMENGDDYQALGGGYVGQEGTGQQLGSGPVHPGN